MTSKKTILKHPSTRFIQALAFVASIFLIFLIFLLSDKSNHLQSDIFSPITCQSSLSPHDTTNISHLVFGLLASTKTWHHRKDYIESWWRPNITHGFLYFDKAPTGDLLPWSPASPPFRVSDDLSKLLAEMKRGPPVTQIRMVHAVIEVFRDVNEGVRWYIMGDDDSIFFVDNMVDVLSKYDHTKYIYIGGHSECVFLNHALSYDMGFGGAGLIMSYPLVKMVQTNIEDCFKRYRYLDSADLMLMTCVHDFGVSMTPHQGLHQMDLHGDVSGLLSSHPKAPLLSLHHIDEIDPLFRSMDRHESAKHLMKAANIDQPRLVQQTICYNRRLNWSYSLSWGFSVHIYERVIPRSILKNPIETFQPWSSDFRPPIYMFNTRPLSNDPCETPHMFSFDTIKKINDNEILTKYVRMASRGLPTCGLAGNHSADLVTRFEVVSPVIKPNQNGKMECCDVVDTDNVEVSKLKLRDCMDGELIA